MCIICADLIKGNLTSKEASRNLNEMITKIDPDHHLEVKELIWEHQLLEDKKKSEQPHASSR